MSFPAHERRYLLTMPGIGPGVVARLEECGFDSLASLGRAGAEQVVDTVARRVGSTAWGNRRRSIERALHGCLQAHRPLAGEAA